MQMGKQLQDKGIPYVASIWAIPEWAYTDPGTRPQRHSRRHIAPEKMDALVTSLVSYLRYARQTYGAEPDLFSFNEANIGNVYGIKAMVMNAVGWPYIVPLRSLDGELA